MDGKINKNTIQINADPQNIKNISGNPDGSVTVNGEKVESVEELTEVVSILIRVMIAGVGGEVTWKNSK